MTKYILIDYLSSCDHTSNKNNNNENFHHLSSHTNYLGNVTLSAITAEMFRKLAKTTIFSSNDVMHYLIKRQCLHEWFLVRENIYGTEPL